MSLFQGQPACAAKRAPLTLKSPLEPGMRISAYYRTEDDSAALHQKVQAALRSCLKDPRRSARSTPATAAPPSTCTCARSSSLLQYHALVSHMPVSPSHITGDVGW